MVKQKSVENVGMKKSIGGNSKPSKVDTVGVKINYALVPNGKNVLKLEPHVTKIRLK